MSPRDSASAARAAGHGASRRAAWWGELALDEGEAALCRVGPLLLAVERREQEWRVGWRMEPAAIDAARGDGDAPGVRLLAAGDLPELQNVARYVTRQPTLRLEPALPDRALVARPEGSFHLLAGEQVDLHVAVPVSVRVLAAEQALVEVPSERLHETWLGASTVSGELCWAASEPARLRREQLAAAPHRARIELTLHNRADAALLVERLSVPVPNLGVWATGDGALLGSAVVVERDADGSMASLRIVEGPPANGALSVAPARLAEPRLGLVRALEALLG